MPMMEWCPTCRTSAARISLIVLDLIVWPLLALTAVIIGQFSYAIPILVIGCSVSFLIVALLFGYLINKNRMQCCTTKCICECHKLI